MEVGEGNCAFARRSARPGDPGLALTMREYFDGSADDKAQAHAEYVEYVPESFEDGRTNERFGQPGLDDIDMDVGARVRSEEA